MNAEMNGLVAAFPSLVQKTSIGLSVEGNIWCLKISDNNEPEVLYLSLQHAREAITGTSLIFFAQYLAQDYATNPAVRDLVNNREIFIVPCVNPDGYVYNEINNPSGGGNAKKKQKKCWIRLLRRTKRSRSEQELWSRLERLFRRFIQLRFFQYIK